MARSRGRSVPAGPKPRSDAYTGMLLISLLAMIIGCAGLGHAIVNSVLYLDWDQYGSAKPPAAPAAAGRQK